MNILFSEAVSCTSCKQILSKSEFHKHPKIEHQPECKTCRNQKGKSYYLKNKQRCIDKGYKRVKERTVLIYSLLKKTPCTDCGEKNPLLLEYDHLGDKIASIAEMRSHNIGKILKEIAKCEVRCSNCHKRKTSERGNWIRYQLYKEDQLIDPTYYFQSSDWILNIG